MCWRRPTWRGGCAVRSTPELFPIVGGHTIEVRWRGPASRAAPAWRDSGTASGRARRHEPSPLVLPTGQRCRAAVHLMRCRRRCRRPTAAGYPAKSTKKLETGGLLGCAVTKLFSYGSDNSGCISARSPRLSMLISDRDGCQCLSPKPQVVFAGARSTHSTSFIISLGLPYTREAIGKRLGEVSCDRRPRPTSICDKLRVQYRVPQNQRLPKWLGIYWSMRRFGT